MPKSRKPRKASRKTSRKGKKCPPGCVKKTLKRSRKSTKRSRRRVSRKASRKRRSVKRKASRKRRSVKRKASRKRRSVKRKVSRKRRSVKRKASRKKKSVKRKVSRKRRSVKRKVSRKRRSVKRKSRKRKSAKRKSRKRKSVTKSHKFRFWGKIKGFIPGTLARSNRLADQKIRKEQKAHLRKTYKEYLQPLIKNYYPGHPQSLYDAVTKYYLEKILLQTEKRADEIVRTGKLIKMGFPARYSVEKYKSVNKKKIGQAYRMYYEDMHKEHLEDCKKTEGYCIKSRSQFVKHHWKQHNDVVAKKQAQQKEERMNNYCSSLQKKFLSTPEGNLRKQFKADLETHCKGRSTVVAATRLRRRVFTGAKKMKSADVAKIRAELDKYKRACADRKKNFSGRKNSLGQYICDGKLNETPTFKGEGVGQQVSNQNLAMAEWNRASEADRVTRCRKGLARFQELSQEGQSRTPTETAERRQLLKLYKQRGCRGIINNAKTAPAKTASLF